MNEPVLRLYPLPSEQLELTGLYLDQQLRDLTETQGKPFVYSNYITSLDGRIAVPHPNKPGMVVPRQIANPRDWRLFQELAVQADILITSGRYLRDYADGRAQEILSVYDDPQFADLRDWRRQNGLPPQPDLAVISASLDFPIPPVLLQQERQVVVVTTQSAPLERAEAIAKAGGVILKAGKEQVGGLQLVERLASMGYRLICNTTGPKVLHLLLAAGVLDRLYLTIASRILGGQPFSSIVEGALLEETAGFKLRSLYYDDYGLEGLGQLFASFDHATPKELHN